MKARYTTASRLVISRNTSVLSSNHGLYSLDLLFHLLQITNFDHSQSFEENIHLCAGALPKWTIESILGPDPHLVKLVDFVKAMLLLVEKSDKVANKWFAQRGEVGVEEEDEEDFWNY